jgi:hypothetical protein
VAARTRLWFVLSGGSAGELDALARSLVRRELAAVVAAPTLDARACGEILATCARLELQISKDLSAPDERAIRALDELASEHPGAEIAMCGPHATLRAALTICLGLTSGSIPYIKLRAGGLYAFDWPAELPVSSAPVLVGADLDWLPPWAPKQARNPYPGGPGAAGTARG